MITQNFRGAVASFLFSAAALACNPATVAAQDIVYHPLNVAIDVARGTVQATTYANAAFVSRDDACRIAVYEWGWQGCDGIDLLIFDQFTDVNSVLINMPTSEGYNRLDD